MTKLEEILNIPTDLQQLITVDQAWHYSIIPKSDAPDRLTVFIDELIHEESIKEELEMLFGKNVHFELIDSDTIHQSLGRLYRKGQKSGQKKSSVIINVQSDDFIYDLIKEAHSVGSSDIHLEAFEEKCRVRIRIDGKLVERYILKKEDYPAMINKIKIKSNLDIAEKRLPQDGRIFFTTGDDSFDIRVSILPTLHGEKVVMRLLSKDTTNIEISRLGFKENQLKYYLESIKKPHGIILISGPTGSGKTTSLYATLKILNKEHSNVLTIEDPIEYTLEGINQVQLKESIGLTFASALRTFLRQDPDVIMLGEIRDGETAQMAVRAALTGHLVLSTIHTNSAWGIISRLIDMGVPAFLLANTINLCVAQRLVRILCPNCKEEKEFTPDLFPQTFVSPRPIKTHFLPCGCNDCFYTGYKGRKAVYEVIPIDNELSDHIKNKNLDIGSVLKQKNIDRLIDTAFSLFEKGDTSLDEIYSILMTNI